MTEASDIAGAVRRFEETAERLTKQLEDILTQMREDRARAEQTYVRRDVAAAERSADQAKVREVEKDLDDIKAARTGEAGFRRQVLLWGAGLSIGTLTSITVAVANIVSR